MNLADKLTLAKRIDETAEERTLYIVQLLQPWESIELLGAPFKANIKGDNEDGMVGFLPVFESLEAAVTWRGERTAEISMIRTVRAEALPLADRGDA